MAPYVQTVGEVAYWPVAIDFCANECLELNLTTGGNKIKVAMGYYIGTPHEFDGKSYKPVQGSEIHIGFLPF